jgi:hypothetical protein
MSCSHVLFKLENILEWTWHSLHLFFLKMVCLNAYEVSGLYQVQEKQWWEQIPRFLLSWCPVSSGGWFELPLMETSVFHDLIKKSHSIILGVTSESLVLLDKSYHKPSYVNARSVKVTVKKAVGWEKVWSSLTLLGLNSGPHATLEPLHQPWVWSSLKKGGLIHRRNHRGCSM